MEGSLFIAVKMPTAQHRKNLLWMLGQDAPVFEEEVPQKWRAMFSVVEELSPDEVVSTSIDIVILNWLCGDWDEAFSSYSKSLVDAGFADQSVYYWADEEEGYLRVHGSAVRPISVKAIHGSLPSNFKKPKKWGAAATKIAQRLVMILS